MDQWVYCVKVLGKCIYTQPQAPYSAFVLIIQNDWTHLSSPDVGPLLAPIEVAIKENISNLINFVFIYLFCIRVSKQSIGFLLSHVGFLPRIPRWESGFQIPICVQASLFHPQIPTFRGPARYSPHKIKKCVGF